jgi:hypothetical protein
VQSDEDTPMHRSLVLSMVDQVFPLQIVRAALFGTLSGLFWRLGPQRDYILGVDFFFNFSVQEWQLGQMCAGALAFGTRLTSLW